MSPRFTQYASVPSKLGKSLDQCWILASSLKSQIAALSPLSVLTPSPAGDYTVSSITVDVYGRVTAASSGTAITAHGSLTGLQGGTTSQYYHLTAAEYTTLQAGSYDHNALTNLDGGTGAGTFAQYYHLTAAEYATVQAYNHESLNGLLGGATSNHYHLTSTEYGSAGGVQTWARSGITWTGSNVALTGATGTVSAGHSITVMAGAGKASADPETPGGDGGALYLRGGVGGYGPAISGANGAVYVGDATTSAVYLGASGITPMLWDGTAQKPISAYALLAGRSGGQTLIGGTAATDDLILRATAGVGASGSDIIFQVGNNGGTEAGRFLYDGKLGLGIAAPLTQLHMVIPAAGVVGQRIKDAGGYGSTTNIWEYYRSDDKLLLSIGRSTAETNARITFNNSASAASVAIEGDGDAINIASAGATAKFRLLSYLSNIYFQNTTAGGDLYFTGANGTQSTGTSRFLSNLAATYAGTATADTQILSLTNSGNAASMTNTRTSILWNQWYYDAGTPAVADAASITVGTDGNWTSTASTQDAYMAFNVAENGTLHEGGRFYSTGQLTLNHGLEVNGNLSIAANDAKQYRMVSDGQVAWSTSAFNCNSVDVGLSRDSAGVLKVTDGSTGGGYLLLKKAGTATADMQILTLENSGNAAAMTNTRTSILWNQWYYDAGTPAVADAASITVGTEGNWTSTASTQDAYMALSVALNGTVTEAVKIASSGVVGIGMGVTAPVSAYLETPGSTSNSSLKVGGMEVQQYAANDCWIADNLYSASGTWKYRANGYAASVRFYNGTLRVATAPSGTAGNTAVMTERLVVGNTGQASITTSEADGIVLSGSNANRTSMYITNTQSSANPSFYIDNNRGSYAAYGGFLVGGSTMTSPLFGLDRNDKLFIIADGASSLGMALGTLTAQPLVIGTNNVERVRIPGALAAAKSNTDLLSLTNSANAADMDGTATSILFRQYYYDASTPAAADAARITVGCETDWTSTGSTQDAYMAFSTAVNGTVTEWGRFVSSGWLSLNPSTTPQTALLLDIAAPAYAAGAEVLRNSHVIDLRSRTRDADVGTFLGSSHYGDYRQYVSAISGAEGMGIWELEHAIDGGDWWHVLRVYPGELVLGNNVSGVTTDWSLHPEAAASGRDGAAMSVDAGGKGSGGSVHGALSIGTGDTESVSICGASNKLGFFGAAAIARPALAADPTAAQISTVLHDLGLVS